MSSPKRKAAAKGRVKFRDIKPKKNPKGGYIPIASGTTIKSG
jgi:hypothetical protein